MSAVILEQQDFETFQNMIYKEAGINLAPTKKLLVQSRLLKRLMHHGIKSYGDYIDLISDNHVEKMQMVNLLTTNETYFFREIEHFEFLQKYIIPEHPYKKKFRFWSAAASVGAEAYSVGMLLDSCMARSDWEVVGTDINSEVIEKAKTGLYPLKWSDKIPTDLKRKYCLKGKGQYEGQFLIDRGLTANIEFQTGNLLKYNGEIGQYDLVFLRNVLIYFDDETKQKVIDNVLMNLKVGGYLVISLTENLNMVNVPSLENIQTSVYRKIR